MNEREIDEVINWKEGKMKEIKRKKETWGRMSEKERKEKKEWKRNMKDRCLGKGGS